MDAQNGEDLTEAFDLGGGTSLAIAIVIALVAMIWSAGTGGAAAGNVIGSAISAAAAAPSERPGPESSPRASWRSSPPSASSTSPPSRRPGDHLHRPHRRGLVSLITAATRGRRHSDRAGSALLLLTSSHSSSWPSSSRASRRLEVRAEAFSFMLAFAAIMAVWAIANRASRCAGSRTPADTTARNMLLSAVLLIVVGMVARLGWVTTEEAEVGGSIVKYSVRILWFLGFTAVVSWVLARTRFGSWTFAVGGNKEAARQVGVPAARRQDPTLHGGLGRCVVGRCAAGVPPQHHPGQHGRRRGVRIHHRRRRGWHGAHRRLRLTIGAGIGALIMAMAVQGIPSARWNSDWRFVFVGGILLLAVVANNYIRTKAESAR